MLRPFRELFNNNNLPSYYIQEDLTKLGYPYSYDLNKKKIVDSFLDGLLDSAKTIRAILWNSITIVSTIITSD